MKNRTKWFLSEEKISHDSEIFDYIVELHDYLWRFVRVHSPGASGKLDTFIDSAIEKAEAKRDRKWWKIWKSNRSQSRPA